MDNIMKKEMGLWLRKLAKELREVKTDDLKPFDGVIQVDGVPYEVQLKPNATLADLEKVIQKMEDMHNKRDL